VSDLFVAGTGCDVAGAFLLARGLLASPADVMRRSVSDGRFFHPVEAASQIRDRVDAFVGLGTLGAGFLMQAIGYALSAGGLGEAAGTIWRGLVAAGIGAAALLLALAIHRALRWPLSRRLIIAVASDPIGLTDDYSVERRDVERQLPNAERLLRLGQEFGKFGRVDEPLGAYARREFRLDEVSLEPDALSIAYMPARLG
jgi:hypothetical protein